MTDSPLTQDEEDDALAGEYVLGVLSLPDRMAVEARLKTDTAFARRVEVWEQHFAGLNAEFTELPVPDLLPQIEARLFPQPAPAKRGAWWAWVAGGLVAAGLGLAVVLMQPAAPTGQLVASLGTPETGLAYEARHEGETLFVQRVAGTAAPAGQTHELWIIAPEAAPVSLGLLGDAPLQVAYPLPPAGWVLAVSVEPAGGSPTGAPTGPVILTAEIGA